VTSAEVLRADLDRLLAERDRPGTVARAVQAVRDQEISVTSLYDDVLVPLLDRTGAAWQSGDARVWEEHFATATVRIIVDAVYPDVIAAATGPDVPAHRGTVVLACPAMEEHDLGLRMLSDRFELAGWRSAYLGANTPTEEIIAAAKAFKADLVVLSVATHYHRLRARDVVDSIKHAIPGVRIALGGAAFEADAAGPPPADLFDSRVIEDVS